MSTEKREKTHPHIGRRALKRGALTVIGVIQRPIPIPEIRDAMTHGMHVAEIRVDLFPKLTTEALAKYVETVREGIPTLLTIRSEKEGGEFQGSEHERLTLYEALMPHVDAVDVELNASIAPQILECAKAEGVLTILSWHDFEGVPSGDALESAVLNVANLVYTAGCDTSNVVLKIAANIRSWDEFLRFAKFVMSYAQEENWNVIAVGMGEQYGPTSRIAFPLIGSVATYAALDEALVPGQLAVKQMCSLFRKLSPS